MNGKLKSSTYKGMLAALVLTVSAPMAMAAQGWGAEGGKGGGHHSAHKSGGGDWDNKGGMESEGHMTMRLRMVWNLDLNDRQKKEIRAITRELREKTQGLDDKIEDTSDELFTLYGGKVRNPQEIGKVYAKIFDYRRQIIELSIDAGNRVEAILTPEQRQAMHKYMPKPRWGSSW
ncbi:MAG: Spy/CpxP family protein refolding chaperone [Gammaproteobacteria bacterium]|nr:Spy/CpxP family protein refolding chaperone [Gammaproteobacteria bacterium]